MVWLKKWNTKWNQIFGGRKTHHFDSLPPEIESTSGRPLAQTAGSRSCMKSRKLYHPLGNTKDSSAWEWSRALGRITLERSRVGQIQGFLKTCFERLGLFPSAWKRFWPFIAYLSNHSRSAVPIGSGFVRSVFIIGEPPGHKSRKFEVSKLGCLQLPLFGRRSVSCLDMSGVQRSRQPNSSQIKPLIK
jgi:hypothetical protein